jgi:spermidine synthase
LLRNALYTASFYKMLLGKLAPGGVFATQSGPGSEYVDATFPLSL